jgi:asparagine N-glycosylation enzyme membrane subunit Stt3
VAYCGLPVLMCAGCNCLHSRNGQQIIVDDYREAYHWLRDKTPKDSRVMAWWDYGYQITGIGERTTIADGASGLSPRGRIGRMCMPACMHTLAEQ